MEINGKTALITGASAGIGRAITLELARNNIKLLIITARNGEKLNRVAEEIQFINPFIEVITIPLDLTKHKIVNSKIISIIEDYGQIDLLINCAGVAYQAPFLELKISNMYEEMAVNLMGMYVVTQIVARLMAFHKEGTIVNVSSLMGEVPAPLMSTYSATKSAILGFSQALRLELSNSNIQVITLLPSLTQTDMTKDFENFRGVISMNPEDVAKTLIGGLNNNTTKILVGWQSHLAVFCKRFYPELLEKILLMATPSIKKRTNKKRSSHRIEPKTSKRPDSNRKSSKRSDSNRKSSKRPDSNRKSSKRSDNKIVSLIRFLLS